MQQAAQADTSPLTRYRYELQHIEVPRMHLSSLKNVRDYVLFFLTTAAFTGVVIALLLADPGRLLAIAPLVGMGSMLSVMFRDAQHRQVPKDLAVAPRRFAQEATIILDSGVEQLRRTEQVAFSLGQTAELLAQATATARSVVSGEPTDGPYLGKGFE